MNPEIVAIMITSETKTIVFCVPITERITSILGRLKAGPAKSNESAGPFPIPAPIRPCKIGTSVKVAKYINAPAIEAKRFARIELPPNALFTHAVGIIPS